MLKTTLLCAYLFAAAYGCSDFIMDNDFRLSVRTMDLGTGPSFTLGTKPKGSVIPGLSSRNLSKFGSVLSFGANMSQFTGSLDLPIAFAGLNEAGLSCDLHSLLNSTYPKQRHTPNDLNLYLFCNWALGSYGTAADVKDALEQGVVTLWGDQSMQANGVHFIVRDSKGHGIAVEFMHNSIQVYEDNNDNGLTGYGVFTNEPEYPWQVANVRHYRWKQSLARPATTMPGTWYPDERFLRIHLIKSAMPLPATYQEAMQQALQVLNTVTVPIGNQFGTDSGFGEGEADHTHYGHIYDHRQAILYWRDQSNMQLQQVRLTGTGALPLAQGAKERSLAYANKLPWYSDASGAFKQL